MATENYPQYFPVEAGKIHLPDERFAKEIEVINRLPLNQFLKQQIKGSLITGGASISVVLANNFDTLIGGGEERNRKLRKLFTDGVILGIESKSVESQRRGHKDEVLRINEATYIAWKHESPEIEEFDKKLKALGEWHAGLRDFEPISHYTLQTLISKTEIKKILRNTRTSNLVQQFEDWRPFGY